MTHRDAPLVRIVDDDPNLRDALSYSLESEGWEVSAYPDARSFLVGDMPSRPGVLVLDVRMPGMSGVELQAELKRRGFVLPIVFLTAHGDIDMAVDALRNGAFHFLQKPVDPEVFLEVVAQAVEADRLRRSGALDQESAEALLSKLTAREREVVERVALGRLNVQIAVELGLSVRTVETHRASAYKKLRVRSAAGLTTLLGGSLRRKA